MRRPADRDHRDGNESEGDLHFDRAADSVSDAKNSEETFDAITVEIDAMEAIARVLADIRDPDARQRILRWADLRFGQTSPTGAATAQAAPTGLSDDASLSVDTLHDLFDGPQSGDPATSQAGTPEIGAFEPVTRAASEPMFTEAELTELDLDALASPDPARHQTPAADETLALAEPAQQPRGAGRAVDAPEAAAHADAACEDQGLDTLVKGFANDLQRLAVDWRT